MAKRVCRTADWLKASGVTDIYSVSGCISKEFGDYVGYWKHNGYWFFNSPEIIEDLARKNGISLQGTSFFYYEAYEMEFDGKQWHPYAPEPSFETHVVIPADKRLEGFDVVTFSRRTSPECSPLSCNYLAKEIPTNAHCLLARFDDAKTRLENGGFNNSEPGPYRIFAVYSVDCADE